ncbi:hypothetical protein [Nonomuraea sediminis]|uniref:hypothetical protein n=1 Tax=Nonomuraea sediminis TaxID=2835864 RepID=UPI001BDCAACA|nr:hypothetical protein [Nonomuraea sediminis]
MGSQVTQFRLYLYACADECQHKLLVRVNRPSYPSADQAADDAAEDFADSAADHLRTWWQRWLLRLDCRREHESRLLNVSTEAISEELDGQGLRQLLVWETDAIIGVASTEEEFRRQLYDYYGPDDLPPSDLQVVSHSVYFLTEQSGTGDLRDA